MFKKINKNLYNPPYLTNKPDRKTEYKLLFLNIIQPLIFLHFFHITKVRFMVRVEVRIEVRVVFLRDIRIKMELEEYFLLYFNNLML